MERKLLAVGKDLKIFERMKAKWEEHGITPVHVWNMSNAIKKLAEDEFFIVGINADNVNYLPLLPIMREATRTAIFIRSSNYDIKDEINAIRAGADSHTKWWDDIDESIIRTKTMIEHFSEMYSLRRMQFKYMSCKEVFVFIHGRRIFVGDTELVTTCLEYNLICLLISSPKRVFTYTQIIRNLWGDEYDDNYNILKSVVHRTRKKLRRLTKNKYINNVHDLGYKCKCQRQST